MAVPHKEGLIAWSPQYGHPHWHTIQIKWLKRLGDLSLGIDSISSDVQQDVWYDLIRS